MSTTTTTTVTATAEARHQELLSKLPAQNVNSLWTAMHAMVTTKPSPKAEVAIWKYKELRPLLLEAGKAVSAEQAERRVLMLTNPALSKSCLSKTCICKWMLSLARTTIHDRHSLRRSPTHQQRRNRARSPPQILRIALHHRGQSGLHRCRRQQDLHAGRRCDLDAEVAMA
jgi:hypothetical protein